MRKSKFIGASWEYFCIYWKFFILDYSDLQDDINKRKAFDGKIACATRDKSTWNLRRMLGSRKSVPKSDYVIPL